MGTPQKPLTDRQKEIYDYIRSCTEKEKMPPTVREIGDKFGISSTNGVRSILSALIKKGYIRHRNPERIRQGSKRPSRSSEFRKYS